MTQSRRLYAGARLGELRRSLGLTQTAFAKALGVSLSYLNQMENNRRPLSRSVIAGLTDQFGIDPAMFAMDESERIAADMREMFADPVFSDTATSRAELDIVTANAPGIAHAFLALHRAYRAQQERLGGIDAAIDRAGAALSPWEEVRDFFHYVDNYIDAIDRAAEKFAGESGFAGRDKVSHAAAWLESRFGVRTELGGDLVRRFDSQTRTLTLSDAADPATQAFQIAHQVALLAHPDLLDATLDLARLSRDARGIARIGLANYFAGAATLPYEQFHAAAGELRHDLDALARRFDASVEQIGHRLSTLQRPNHAGVPFFFARVDRAGTITKRHSATRLQFARFGGACPLWNVHQAFETPGRIIRQLAETPDRARYLCLARTVVKPGGSFRAPERRYAIALGCEIRFADRLVYADDLDTGRDAAFEKIGVSCRICERRNCHQRSVPPLERNLRIDPDRRDILPYRVN